ncbi:ABC transporter permease [Saccharibacillus sp. CPCC 101409]|uniref:ABC transporter permease n=1 Tax=Saccharibacillus sp. CPCC 101409 TaxID=3058041 RepID=UPI0026740A9F|nr:ABC transporter permease [Saccharibacillus sp. CPCC 101409]MDO3410104.1 ABC transporter permease [Saccharibacillus sp. CPCC 101409]
MSNREGAAGRMKTNVSMGSLLKSEGQRVFKRKRTGFVAAVYLIFVLLDCIFLTMTNTSFYDPGRSVPLDSLNAAPFLLRELALLMNFVVIPMLAADSFGGDVSSGALRLVLIRPASRSRLFLAKWLVQGMLVGTLTLLTWGIGTAFGRIAMPHADRTTLMGAGTVGSGGALLFTLGFYAVAFCIFLALIGVGGIVARIVPNPVLAYIGILGVVVGGIYVSDRLAFLLSVSDSIFHFLGGDGGSDVSLGWIVCALLAGCVIIGTLSWRRREWTQ